MRLRLALAGVAVSVLVLGAPGLAAASGLSSPYTSGWTGHDVGWPQCGASLPAAGEFGIVGVTHGRAFTQNTCLSAEYAWAAPNPASPSTSIAPPLYLNLNAPIGSTAHGNTSSPELCSRKDAKLCQSYNYGWNAAQAAYDYASATLGTFAVGTTWWLDVETGNSWSSSTAANAQVVQGAIGFFSDAYGSGVSLPVGIYSTPTMWSSIAGTANPGVPAWYATAATGATAAASYCTPTSFTGGPVWLVQYSDGSGIDADYAC